MEITVYSKSGCPECIFTKKFLESANISFMTYFGNPVKARFLIALKEAPSLRLLSCINDSIKGCKLRYIGNISEDRVFSVWNNPIECASVYPDFAARIMLAEPITAGNPVSGIELREEPVKPIEASHKNPKDKSAVIIGKAYDTTGKKEIYLSEALI